MLISFFFYFWDFIFNILLSFIIILYFIIYTSLLLDFPFSNSFTPNLFIFNICLFFTLALHAIFYIYLWMIFRKTYTISDIYIGHTSDTWIIFRKCLHVWTYTTFIQATSRHTSTLGTSSLLWAAQMSLVWTTKQSLPLAGSRPTNNLESQKFTSITNFIDTFSDSSNWSVNLKLAHFWPQDV